MTPGNAAFIAPLLALSSLVACGLGTIDLGSGDDARDLTEGGAGTEGKAEPSSAGGTSGTADTEGADTEGNDTENADEGDTGWPEQPSPEDLAMFYAPCRTSNFDIYGSQAVSGGCDYAERREQFPPDSELCFACMCGIRCRVDEDCSVPASSTAQAVCLEEGDKCGLVCERDDDCPDGTRCVPHHCPEGTTCNGPRESLCMLVEDQGLECSIIDSRRDAFCPQFDNEADCNAEQSDHSPLRCLWVEEQLFGNGSDDVACTPSQVTGRCLMTVELAEADREEACNAACDDTTASYWEDVGAGTYSLLDMPCELAPYGRENEMCGVEGVRDPLLCGCGGALACP